VYAFVGGIPEWRFYNYPMIIDKEWQKIKVPTMSPKEFAEIIGQDKSLLILDTRPSEFKADTAFFRNALHIPLIHLEERYREIPRQSKIVITDWAMKQSPMAAKFLIKKGYQVQGVLKGGLERFKTEIRNSDLLEERTPPVTQR
jgi:rhodanese-related sulfurtransferase